jgi:hypothetical protein
MSDYFFCPHCGAVVPANASACPECGSDEETGWSQDAAYGELFAYYDEAETGVPASKPWTRYLVPALAVLTLSAFLAYWLPWGIYLVPVVFLVVGVAYYATQVLPNTRRSAERQLYRDLLRKTRGDRELAERLIGYERKRRPGADRLQLLQDAIYRWERDNR